MKRIFVSLAILLAIPNLAFSAEIKEPPIPAQEQDLIDILSKFNKGS